MITIEAQFLPVLSVGAHSRGRKIDSYDSNYRYLCFSGNQVEKGSMGQQTRQFGHWLPTSPSKEKTVIISLVRTSGSIVAPEK